MTQQLPKGFVIENTQTTSALPEGFVIETPAERLEETPAELEGQQGIFESFSEWFSGASRNTPSLDRLPTVVGSGFLAGESVADVAKVGALLSLTNDPSEMAQIIQKQLPNIRVQYDKDAKGNIYPILTNPNTGVTAVVDKPGADLMNLSQFVTQAAAFSIGGGSGGIMRTAATEGGKELALQGAQAAAGGDVDAGDVVGAAVIGGGFQGAGELIKKAYMGVRGQATEAVQGVISAAKELNIPVMTSDIYNPKNWFTRGAQIASESMPVVGTGGMRVAQQEARQQALDDFVSLYRGGTYEEIIESIGLKNKEMQQAAGAVYNRINPYLTQISPDGVPMPAASQEVQSLIDYLTTQGLDVDDSVLSLADDLEQLVTGTPQSFQVLKDNISAWHERINSIDPNSRALPSKIKARFDKVLNAARQDRDAFAEANLSETDYASLKKADEVWGEMVTNMSTTKMKSILDKGDVTPEVARQMLFSRNKSDIQRLYTSLTPQGQSTARAAFIGQIVDDLGKQQKGLSPDSFATALNKYSDGIDVLFQGERKKEIQGLMNAFEATRHAQAVERGAGSQTFERGLGVLAIGGTAGGAIPLEALGAYASVGAMARILESPKVRNILIKMNGVNPASEQAQQLVAQLNRLVAASLQANPLKGQSEYEKEISEEMRARNQPQGAN